MSKVIKLIYTVVVLCFVYYLLLPSPPFPNPPVDAVRSTEPADSETELRRAYFTNYTREEVIKHYKEEFPGVFLIRLNYPPEEAQTIIRDQTRSTFLEELAHPFKGSIYINGFEPKEAKDAIVYQGQPFRQKLIIRHVDSSPLIRVFVALFSAVIVWFTASHLLKESLGFLKRLRRVF